MSLTWTESVLAWDVASRVDASIVTMAKIYRGEPEVERTDAEERARQRVAERGLGAVPLSLSPEEREAIVTAKAKPIDWRCHVVDQLSLPERSYVDQVKRVVALLANGQMWVRGQAPTLWLDATGVGNGVLDLCTSYGLVPVPVTIVSAHSSTRVHAGWHVSKADLVSTLLTAFDAGRLRLAADLIERERIVEELGQFRVIEDETTGFQRFAGARDDRVLSLAIATWAASHPSQYVSSRPDDYHTLKR